MPKFPPTSKIERYSGVRGKPQIEIIPAIDIRDGRCVSLYMGDYHRETVFSDNPVETALEWQSIGAARLHIVDLDGAKSGDVVNFDIITEIAEAVLVPTQVGGGVRSLATIEKLLHAGVERVIISTAAVENPDLVREACKSYRDSVIIAIDARDGKIATHGWEQDTGLDAVSFARAMAKLGARRFIYTDVNRNATLTEPNFSAISELIEQVRLPVIASGGISSINHLKMLQKLGAEGAIVGKALYTGDINFKQARQELNGQAPVFLIPSR